MPYRTANVGSCYEYYPNGNRLIGTDTLTREAMIRLSATWPDTIHQHIDPSTTQNDLRNLSLMVKKP